MKQSRRRLTAGLVLGTAMGLFSRGRADDKQKDEKKKLEGKPVVILDTSLGVIEIELDAEKAPISAQNFVDYVEAKHYDGLVFHRVIPNFMIQGGGYDPNFKERATKPPIKNESSNGLKNDRGTVAMARTSAPNSATAQFFINVRNNDFLNKDRSQDGVGYAVFGKVTVGLDVVDKIKEVQTGSKGPHSDVPLTPVVIKTARVKA